MRSIGLMYVERDGSVLFCVRIVLLKPTTGADFESSTRYMEFWCRRRLIIQQGYLIQNCSFSLMCSTLTVGTASEVHGKINELFSCPYAVPFGSSDSDRQPARLWPRDSDHWSDPIHIMSGFFLINPLSAITENLKYFPFNFIDWNQFRWMGGQSEFTRTPMTICFV